jgi:hypothetical protein
MPDDGTLAPGKFYADYPLWTLHDVTLEKKVGEGGKSGIPQINFPTIGAVLALFTDTDLAKRFLDETHRSGLSILGLKDPEALLKIAEYFQKRGVKHVAIDISTKPPSAAIHPIGEFIDDVRRSRD